MNFRSTGSDGREGRPQAGPYGGGGGLPVALQSSIYSLTFDEFQNSLGGIGMDFGSMNMDKFLKNIWTAEETQATASASAMGPSAECGGMAGLQRQGSLTLPRTLSQKTVDEVWRDLFREGCGGGGGGQGGAAESCLHAQQRQPTLGEITLEEFLVRAGVVREDLSQQPASRPVINSVNTSNNFATSTATTTTTNSGMFFGDVSDSNLNSSAGLAHGFSPVGRRGREIASNSILNSSSNNVNGARPPYAAPPPMKLGNTAELANQQGMRGGEMLGIGDPAVNSGLMPSMAGLGADAVTVVAAVVAGSPANRLSLDGLGKNGDLSSLSPVPYSFNGGLGGRKCGGVVGKVVERRQRRMIKNRESAARSRAQKQAYNMELEAEVAKLKEQNQVLQNKQEEILEMQKIQVLGMINQQCGPKKQCLRRTQTGPW